MPTMRYQSNAAWGNYHQTLGTIGPNGSGPELSINSLASIDASDEIHASGIERFAATGAALFGHLRGLESMSGGSPNFAAGMVGSAWSFAPLIGTPVSQLLCNGLSGIGDLAADEWHPDCCVPADYIALASGGTAMHDIVQWAEKRSRTLRTSGSYLGPTIAGGFATASHGSRLGYGGIQNMVLGMHLIVGSNEHVWIERKSCPVLSAAAVGRLAVAGIVPRVVQDDDRFEDALIHLGAMGIVNGVALKLTANRRFALMQRVEKLTPDWLDEIANEDFAQIARRLGCDVPPIFYEMTLNPHAPFDDLATHIMYVPTSKVPLTPAGDAGIIHPADAIARLGSILVPPGDQAAPADMDPALHAAARHQPVPPWVLRALLHGADSVFAFYRSLKPFASTGTAFDPEDPSLPAYLWSELHPGGITGGIPGALYNASFAIPLDRVADAVPVICAAVGDLSASFVFTMRFVSKAAGTLAFTRFDQNAVIEIDGLSPLICLLAKAGVDPNQPNAAEFLRALDELAVTLPAGAAAVRGALDTAGIPYSMHWAKLGGLDQAKVYADYGHPFDTDSLIRRWRETRESLLSPFGMKVFWNNALVAYGLI